MVHYLQTTDHMTEEGFASFCSVVFSCFVIYNSVYVNEKWNLVCKYAKL